MIVIKVTLDFKNIFGYRDAEVVAPNNLYNAASGIPNAQVVSGPSSVKAKPYLEYFGKQ